MQTPTKLRMINKKTKVKKAYSLVEIIIVLSIISVVLIGAVATMIRSAYQLRLNEVEDTANSFTLKASEFLKSPTVIRTLNYPGNQISNNNNKFNLFQDPNTQELFLEVNNSSDFSSDCNETNSFNVRNILGANVNVLADICMQITIESAPRTNLNASYSFKIDTKYQAGEDTVNKTFFGYRYSNISR